MKDSRISRYNMFEYTTHFYNSSADCPKEERDRALKFRSSCLDEKSLNDTAVRLAKNHGWKWTSLSVTDSGGKIVGIRVARKARASVLESAITSNSTL